MIKLAAFIAALILCFMPIAYAETINAANSETALYDLPTSMPFAEFNAPKPGSDFSNSGDLGIVIDENWYPIMLRFDAMQSALGEPKAIVLTESDAHPDYYDKEFVYDFGSVFTHPIDGIDVWCGMNVNNGNIKTSRGIGIDSTLNDMIAAYGDECYVDKNDGYVYSRSGTEKDYATPSITFKVANDAVVSMTIYYPVFEQ